MGLRADVVEQNITETLETNYMPYAMSVIVSRAIPEIDGFKPSHRKLLYTMYKMGLLTGARTKLSLIHISQSVSFLLEVTPRFELGNEGFAAVSYTHLDVYKRQASRRRKRSPTA